MKSIQHEKSFRIAQPIEVLFPLFSAEGEKHWVPGWNYRNIMGTTELHEDYIFVTESHDHAANDAIWLVKKHDPESHYVSFYKVEPDEKVGIIIVSCTALTPRETKVSVSYEYIALSERGEEFVTSFTPEKYKEFIGEWEHLLNEYFNSKA